MPNSVPADDGRAAGGTRTEVLRGLVERGVINARQAEAVATALDAADRDHQGVRWAEVVGYVGGGLVFAGVCAVVGLSWQELGGAAKLVVLVGIALALLVGGVVAAGGPAAAVDRAREQRTGRRRLTGVLWSLSSVAVLLAAGEAMDDHGGTVPLAAGLTVAAAAYFLVPSAVGLVACGVFSPFLVTSAVEGDLDSGGLTTGLLLVGLGVAWAGLSASRLLTHRALGYGIGAAIAVIGAHTVSVYDVPFVWTYALTFVIAVLCLALYAWEKTWVLLAAGVIGITIAVPEAVWDWTDGSVGGAAVLLVTGLVLLLASGIGLGLRRAVTASPPAA